MDLDLTKYNATKSWFLGSEIKKILLNFVDKKQKYNILEIGCFEGLSASAFSDNIMDHDLSTLDCVDPFYTSGTVEGITSQFVNEAVKIRFLQNISNSKNYRKITFHNKTSDSFFEKNTKTFNLIYLDGCHEPGYITRDMTNSFNCLENQGIMWMDDYGGNTTNHGKVKIWMDNWLKKHDGEYKILHKKYQLAIQKCVTDKKK